MDWDLKNVEQLFIPPFDKHHSFSTSTPFVQTQEHKLRSLSVCITSSTPNDSGLGASISEVSVASLTNNTDTCPVITVSVCHTPTCADTPSFNARQLEVCVSPVSTKRFSSRRLESDFNSRNSFCARRSLDLDLRSGDSCHSSKDILEFDERKKNRTFDTNFARKLNLDLDIYDSSESLHEESLPKITNLKECLLVSQFNEVLQRFSPGESDRIIGRKMGRERVDILTELHNRNISCISNILCFLESQDLCRMCSVSRQWKEVCEANRSASQRRRRFLRHQHDTHKLMGKENSGKRLGTHQARTGAMPLQDLPVLQLSVDIPVRNVKTTTEQFISVASKLKNDEKLQKCPRCRKPAKVLPVQDRGKCQNLECTYDYCTKCLCEFHGSKDCAPIASKKTKTDAIGTCKSKKNLKRL